MNRDYPLAPTFFGDPEKKAARKERREVREGTRREPKVTKRQQRKWSKNINP
jgi:hypothetical protein